MDIKAILLDFDGTTFSGTRCLFQSEICTQSEKRWIKVYT